LQDAQRLVSGRREPTFPSRYPRFRIDYVFVSKSVEVDRVEVLRSAAARIASDHLPLTVDLRIPIRARPTAGEAQAQALNHV
jgi:endonuclease/exonuclease/phosphatase family metal-dependent hydrolase